MMNVAVLIEVDLKEIPRLVDNLSEPLDAFGRRNEYSCLLLVSRISARRGLVSSGCSDPPLMTH
jgi:hypothetical protein